MNIMKVIASHTSNPDIRSGGYWDGKPTEGKKTYPIQSFVEAVAVCRDYINRNGLGGGNWTGGQILKGKKQIARISFNGRIWDMEGNEISVEN